MKLEQAQEILEAMALGCCPLTGEVFEEGHVLKTTEVSSALALVVQFIKTNSAPSIVAIDQDDVDAVLLFFYGIEESITANKLTCFFLATRKFRNEKLVDHPLYGKYKNKFQKGELLDFFTKYGQEHGVFNQSNTKFNRKLAFFEEDTFNRLTENGINQLKEKIKQLDVRDDNELSEQMLNARKIHKRAYEPWSDYEKELLQKAVKYTNDLSVLSACFQRGIGSMRSAASKLIHEETLEVK